MTDRSSGELDPGLVRLAAGVVVTGFDGITAPDWLLARIESGLAGVCWFAQNIGDATQTRALADQLHAVRSGVVVMSDEEGGDVTRLDVEHGSPWPSHAALGALDDVDTTSTVATEMGRQLRAAGIDIALAPVVDVNSNPDNPVIGVRSFGSTPELASRHGAAFVEGLQSSGISACAKHYPGHGSTLVDSHLGLPTVVDPAAVVRARDLAPFAAVVAAGVRSVMTAHVVFTAYDDRPATLSPVLLGMLRRELGFGGVLVSDALDMKAISAGVGHGEGAVLTLLAGTDLVCIGNPGFPATYDAEERLDLVVDAIAIAVAEGRLPRERLEEAAARIEALTSWTADLRTRSEPDVDRSVGADAARRIVRHRGSVRVTRPVVLDLAGSVSIAAGRRDRWLVEALVARDPRTLVRDVASTEELAKGLLDARDRDPVVLARTPRSAETRDHVDRVLEERPEAVIVQTGLADPESAGANAVWTFGGGRALADAAAELLLPEVDR